MKYLLFILPAFFSFCWADDQDPPVCKHCQIIREYNRTHKETDFIYYEDYLKDKAEKETLKSSTKVTPSSDSAVTK